VWLLKLINDKTGRTRSTNEGPWYKMSSKAANLHVWRIKSKENIIMDLGQVSWECQGDWTGPSGSVKKSLVLLNPFRGSLAPLGLSLLTVEVSKSHSDTARSVGRLWESDQPDTETSTWQHTTLTRNRHACRHPTNPAAADRRLRPHSHWDRRLLQLVLLIRRSWWRTETVSNVMVRYIQCVTVLWW
jgi:hypothetical protein